ncbi:MAG: polysaccharide deacetylase family protein [Terriglobales bacterium]|jgi:peptidoglycan/xylan/chitin deacetylase (PgdA/CDA1 family)
MDKPALISLTFDDGLRCQFERAVPILDQHGFSATFFLVANSDSIHTDGCSHPDWAKTTWSEEDKQFLKQMVRRGHEVGAHSVHHRHPFLDKDPKSEAEGSRRWIEDRLEVEVPSYCYPFCHVTLPIKSAVIGAGYKQARGGASSAYYAPQDPVDLFNVDCRFVAETDHVDGWLRPDRWHILTFHGIGTLADGWAPVTVAQFAAQMAELAQRREAGAVEVVTFKEGAGRLRTNANRQEG